MSALVSTFTGEVMLPDTLLPRSSCLTIRLSYQRQTVCLMLAIDSLAYQLMPNSAEVVFCDSCFALWYGSSATSKGQAASFPKRRLLMRCFWLCQRARRTLLGSWDNFQAKSNSLATHMTLVDVRSSIAAVCSKA